MKKLLGRLILAGIAVLIVAQFFRPERTNPASDPNVSIRRHPGVPPAVLATLERSCFNCHSNETHWPWYSNITPVNYLVVSDVNDARKRMNFSEWGAIKTFRIQSLLDRIPDEISDGGMPLPRYVMMHPEAKLSAAEIKAISDWTDAEQDRLSDSTQVDTGN